MIPHWGATITTLISIIMLIIAFIIVWKCYACCIRCDFENREGFYGTRAFNVNLAPERALTKIREVLGRHESVIKEMEDNIQAVARQLSQEKFRIDDCIRERKKQLTLPLADLSLDNQPPSTFRPLNIDRLKIGDQERSRSELSSLFPKYHARAPLLPMATPTLVKKEQGD